MKRKLLWQISVVMVVVALLTSTVAYAAPSTVKKINFPPQYHQPGPYRGGISYSAARTAGDGPVTAQAIALGKPGTTFRWDRTFGVSTQAYPQDDNHVNGAVGIDTDDAGNVYVAEEGAARLVKYNSTGEVQWQVGGAGFHDWGANGLNWPRELFYLLGAVVVADQDHVSEWNSDTGELIYYFPPEPWNTTDDFRFFEMRGITFDQQYHIYVSDAGRHRIQVYNLTPDGPTYQATIGETDTPGADATHFNRPMQLKAVGNTLFVADLSNGRVQKCEPNDTFTAWTCETFFDGDDVPLNFVYGLGADAAGNLFITDNGNGRIFKCPTDGSGDCAIWLQGLNWPTDIAFRQDNGNALVSIYDDFLIAEYTPEGGYVGIFKGVNGEPYLTDSLHYDFPSGVDIDTSGNIYIAEQNGARLTKLNPAGTVIWQKGIPGNPFGDAATHINSPSGLAVDKTKTKIYLTESGAVRVYSAVTGAYLSRFDQGQGEGDYQFKDARGIAFDPSGNFYIVDAENQRVMKYDKNGIFKKQLGVTGEPGRDNSHFAWPSGVGTDKTGALYVADRENCRVQKFDKNGNFLMTVGTAMCGDSFDRMGGPVSVVVDAKGNIYVGEAWANRVNVYSSTGAYLTTIAGEWGDANNQMRNPNDLALDSKGNLYVADQTNNRIQKFMPGVPYAAQVSLNGFGNRYNNGRIGALGSFKGQLYAGLMDTNQGAQILRLGTYGWEVVMPDAFQDGANRGIDHLLEWNGYLYATTYNCTNDDCTTSNGGQIWRSMDGLTWMPVVTDGFGDSNNTEIFRLAPLGIYLCATTWSGTGTEIWCSMKGEPDTWMQVNTDGFGDLNNGAVLDLVFWNNRAWAGTFNMNGGQLWSSPSPNSWSQVPTAFGPNAGISAMEVFNKYLYVVTAGLAATDTDPAVNSTIWRCQACDGNDWTRVDPPGMNIPGNRTMPSLEVIGNSLYAVIGNRESGLHIYKTTNGTTWTAVSVAGLGSGLSMTYWDNGVINFKNALYLGVFNSPNGASVWKICSGATCK